MYIYTRIVYNNMYIGKLVDDTNDCHEKTMGELNIANEF